MKKEKQRIWWNSSINVKLIAYKKDISRDIATGLSRLFGDSKWARPLGYQFEDPNPFSKKSGEFANPRNIVNEPKFTEHLSGKAKFEIIWSVTYTMNKKFLTPKIEEIKP